MLLKKSCQHLSGLKHKNICYNRAPTLYWKSFLFSDFFLRLFILEGDLSDLDLETAIKCCLCLTWTTSQFPAIVLNSDFTFLQNIYKNEFASFPKWHVKDVNMRCFCIWTNCCQIMPNCFHIFWRGYNRFHKRKNEMWTHFFSIHG